MAEIDPGLAKFRMALQPFRRSLNDGYADIAAIIALMLIIILVLTRISIQTSTNSNTDTTTNHILSIGTILYGE